MDAEAAGQFFDALDALFAAFADNIGRTKLFCQCDAIGVASHDYYLLSTETFCGYDTAQADRSITYDRDTFTRADICSDVCVVAGAHHVGKRKERREESFILRH